MTERICWVTSDLHLGGGSEDIHEDFYQDDAFAAWVESLGGDGAALVLNGDVIEFAQLPPFEVPGLPSALLWGVDASMEKYERVEAGHPVVFDALAAFLERGGKLEITIGNHDLDLIWDEVQDRFRTRLGSPTEDALRFAVGGVQYEGVLIQHGHQFTPENRPVDAMKFVHEYNGKRYLERVWGTDFVLRFFNPLESEFPFADNVKPAVRLLMAGARNRWIRAEHLVLLASFIKRAGLPPDILGAVLSGEDDVETLRNNLTVANVAASFEDPELRELVVELAADPDARTEIDAALKSLDAEQAKAVESPKPVAVDAEPVDVEVEEGETLGLFRKSREFRAGKKLAAKHRHVVFGHTHRIIDGEDLDGSGAKLFNPGTWIPRLRIKSSNVTQGMLRDHTLYRWELRAVAIPSDQPDAIHMVEIPTPYVEPGPEGRPVEGA